MKKINLLTIFLGLSLSSFSQSKLVKIPQLNKTFSVESVIKSGDNTYSLINPVEIGEEPVAGPSGMKEVCGIFIDVQQSGGFTNITCKSDWRYVFFYYSKKDFELGYNDKYLVSFNNNVYLSTKRPNVALLADKINVSFTEDKPLTNFGKEDFEQIAGGGDLKPILGMVTQMVKNGNVYQIQCSPAPGFCIVWAKAPMNFYDNNTQF
jgi:hypothetical protein